jgi:hypothetical protein
MAITVKGMLLGLGLILFSEQSLILVWIVACMTVYGCMTAIWQPWRHALLSCADVIMHAVVVMIGVMTAFYISLDDSKRSVINILTIVLSFTCLPVAICAAALTFVREKSLVHTRAKAKQIQEIYSAARKLANLDETSFKGLIMKMGDAEFSASCLMAASLPKELPELDKTYVEV